jgi:hypothetical protein
MTKPRQPWIGTYKLVGKLAVPVEDSMEWARGFENSNRQVADTKIGGIRISTIFLGLDHNFLGGKPLLFETMIFRGGKGDDCFRCSSWEEAEKQHADAVALVRAEIKEKVNE